MVSSINSNSPNNNSNSSSSNTYTVKKGDTLSEIARDAGVSLSSVIKSNPQIKNPNLIYPGQQINMPSAGGNTGNLSGLKVSQAAMPQDSPVDMLRAPSGGGMLREGSRGPAVAEMQQQLKQLGFNPGPADGVFGPRTEAAVKSFQQSRGITSDGVFGPQSRAAMSQPAVNNGSRPAMGNGGVDGVRDNASTNGSPSWLNIARGEIGTKEIAGSRDNQRIIEYHSTTGKFGDDEVPWCASFVNWTLKEAGIKGTGSAMARSFLNWGKPTEPKPGAVVVFSRGNNPSQGHVGFYLGTEGNMVKVLGGNQSDQVKVSYYPKSSVLGYRWPK